MATIFVTGGAGFIGSNFVRYWLEQYPDDRVIAFDLLTYAGNRTSIEDMEERHGDRCLFIQGDIGNEQLTRYLFGVHRPDWVVNFAAESHNSWAVINPGIFFETNVVGTQRLLQAAHATEVPRVHHISTCEVYGDLPLDTDEVFTEESPYRRPRTPYNAAKAGADLAVRAYAETFGLPVTISNCSNNYGPYQYPEKLIPKFATLLIQGQQVPLYKSSQNKREWLHVDDHCRAVDLILKKGAVGETYNIGSGVEQNVEEITDLLLEGLGLDASYKKYVPDRPGHDRRYLLDSSKIRNQLGWALQVDFAAGFRQTVEWYKANDWWWKPLLEKPQIDEQGWQ